MSKVYITKTGPQHYNGMSRLVSELELPENAQNICIKLNLCEYRYRETGVTSDPYVVSSLLEVLRKRYPNSTISLIENDASSVSADNIFSFLGFDTVAGKYNCNLVNIAHEKWVKKNINGLRFKSVRVPQILGKCDLFITHPKLKTHTTTKMTCSLKNQFGCLRPKNKAQFHNMLDEAIVDANLAMKPDFSIVDANICLEGSNVFMGPIYGVPKKLGLLIGGADIVAVDAFCAKLMGFNPYFIGHLRKAAAKGIGSSKYSLQRIDVANDFDLKDCKFKFSRFMYYSLKLVRWRIR